MQVLIRYESLNLSQTFLLHEGTLYNNAIFFGLFLLEKDKSSIVMTLVM